MKLAKWHFLFKVQGVNNQWKKRLWVIQFFGTSKFPEKTTLLFQVQFSRRSEGAWCFARRFVVFFCAWSYDPTAATTITTTTTTTTTTATTVGWFVELRAEVLLSVCAARNMNYAQLQWKSQDPVGLAPLELYTAPTMKRAGIQYQKGRTLEFSPSLLLFLYQISFIKLQIICDRLCFEGSPYQLLSPFN